MRNLTTFASVHGLIAMRVYNTLCARYAANYRNNVKITINFLFHENPYYSALNFNLRVST